MAAAAVFNTASLQSMLQTAVQSVHWTYSLFWQFSPQQGALVWRDGYYNGSIKTRKTVQATEVTAEEASLQRSQQLRELYDSLATGDANPRRPSAALSPEDLTETEWFYLMCVSFSFPPGTGLPGKAYSKRQHVWLAGANEVESKVFSRAILAKSAHIQTVVCIPVLDGVVELGTTHKVREEHGFIQRLKCFFLTEDSDRPRPALSEHSTSNPLHNEILEGEERENDGEDDEEDDEEDELESEEEVNGNTGRIAMAESTELMQAEMSEDIRLRSPDDCSNNLDSDFHLLAVTQPEMFPSSDFLTNTRPTNLLIHPPLSDQLDEFCGAEEDSHYSQTVSTVLHHQTRSSSSSSSVCASSAAFSRWSPRLLSVEVTIRSPPQYIIKHILFRVPFLYCSKIRDDTADDQISPKSRDDVVGDGSVPRLRRGGASQEDLSANHVLAERRRREKLNERFIVLRSLVPFVTKMDKASILGDTIEYVKQLRRQVEDLEARDRRSVSSRSMDPGHRIGTSVNRTGSGSEKRKVRIVEGIGGKPRTILESPPLIASAPTVAAPDSTFARPSSDSVEVSIIERDALLELRCAYKEGLLLDIMHVLRELGVETTSVQSSLNDGVFVAELRAKVKKENGDGKRVSIVEVKRAIRQIIPHGS